MTSMNSSTRDSKIQRISPPSSSSPTLLSLPSEIRNQVYTYLIRCNDNLIIRSLFIRERFGSSFMTQQPKGVYVPLLSVCRQISSEALPILYAAPLWKCGCRLDALASQIGYGNVSLIRRMNIEFDDLKIIAASLEQASLPRDSFQSFEFNRLELLEAVGFQMNALHDRGTRRSRLEAIWLCELAQRILELHPRLRILAQEQSEFDGGSDAKDITMGRTKWRFLAERRDLSDKEHVVDLAEILERLRMLCDETPAPMDGTWSLWEYEFHPPGLSTPLN